MHIQPDYTHYSFSLLQNVAVNGFAISSVGSSNLSSNNYLISLNNDFNSCAYATSSFNTYLTDIEYNSVHGTGCIGGFYVRGGIKSVNNISNNPLIKDVQIGICLTGGLNSKNNIFNNTNINLQPLPTTNTNSPYKGIDIEGLVGSTINVQQNTIIGGRDAIYCLSTSTGQNNTSVWQNSITLNNNSLNISLPFYEWQSGIHLVNCNIGTKIYSNCIQGMGGYYSPVPNIPNQVTSPSVHNQRGIALETSPNVQIYGNATIATEFGLYFEGLCTTPNGNIHNNSMVNNYWGYGTYENGNYGGTYGQTGEIGSQPNLIVNHNEFKIGSCGSSASINARSTVNFTDNNGGAYRTQFDQRSSDNFNANGWVAYNYLTNGILPPGLHHFSYPLLVANGLNFPINTSCEYLCTLGPGISDGGDTTVTSEVNIDSLVAVGDDSLFDDHPAISMWKAQRALYRTLVADTALRDTIPVFYNFYDSIHNTPLGGLETVKNILAAGQDTSLTSDQAALFNYLVANDTLGSDTDGAFINNIIAYMPDSVQAGLDSAAYVSILASVSTANSKIGGSAVQETNEMQVNALQYKLIAGGLTALSTTDTSWLNWLASSCPLVEGDAVYIARAIASMWLGPIYMNDVVLCHPETREMQYHPPYSNSDTSKLRETFKFMPIPASEYLMLAYKADADFIVRIFAVTGQKISEIKMRGINTSQYINIDNFTTGIYYYEIIRDNKALQRGNLSILK